MFRGCFMKAHVDETLVEVTRTPVQRVSGLGLAIKRDDLTNPLYGGNKVRKLAHLLVDARRRHAKRLVTTGAWGSHHALATATFGVRAGFDVKLLLVPQPRTPHVDEVLAATRQTGAEVVLARGVAELPLLLARGRARGDAWIPPGGSNEIGSLGYVEAAAELAAQIARGEADEPDEIVLAVGTGGTAAGLAIGLSRAGLRTKIVGAVVVSPALISRLSTRALIARLARDPREAWDAERRLTLDASELGGGYGEPTNAGRRAEAICAREAGVALDLTYTAKAFALALRRKDAGARVLYWHTLAATR